MTQLTEEVYISYDCFLPYDEHYELCDDRYLLHSEYSLSDKNPEKRPKNLSGISGLPQKTHEKVLTSLKIY